MRGQGRQAEEAVGVGQEVHPRVYRVGVIAVDDDRVLDRLAVGIGNSAGDDHARLECQRRRAVAVLAHERAALRRVAPGRVADVVRVRQQHRKLDLGVVGHGVDFPPARRVGDGSGIVEGQPGVVPHPPVAAGWPRVVGQPDFDLRPVDRPALHVHHPATGPGRAFELDRVLRRELLQRRQLGLLPVDEHGHKWVFTRPQPQDSERLRQLDAGSAVGLGEPVPGSREVLLVGPEAGCDVRAG